MSISTTQKAITGAAFLALSSAAKSASIPVTGSTIGSGGQLGVDHLSLDEMPGHALTICTNNSSTQMGTNITANDLTVAVDPFTTGYMELVFAVSDVPASTQDHILFLVYSTGLSPSPQILTPRSIRKLELDMTYNEIAAMYNVPKQIMMAQDPTRIGAANPAPMSKVLFKVNLDTAKIPALVRNGQPTIYAQAALIRKVDFDNGKFDNMILSEVDKITFAANTCTSVSGGKTATESSGQLTKSTTTGTVALGGTTPSTPAVVSQTKSTSATATASSSVSVTASATASSSASVTTTP